MRDDPVQSHGGERETDGAETGTEERRLPHQEESVAAAERPRHALHIEERQLGVGRVNRLRNGRRPRRGIARGSHVKRDEPAVTRRDRHVVVRLRVLEELVILARLHGPHDGHP